MQARGGRFALRPFVATASVGPWTALVTSSSVALSRATRDASWIARGQQIWARGLLHTWGVEVTLVNEGKLDAPGPCVLMANHESNADVPILFAALPFVPGFLAKKELARIPFLSMALRAGGHVLVDRADGRSAIQSIKAAAAEVRGGKTLVVFPEGTRRSGEILPFKRGAFVIAKRAGVPIVPVGIRGSGSVLPRGAILPRAGRVSVHVGAPIPTARTPEGSIDALCERVRRKIAALAGLPFSPDGT